MPNYFHNPIEEYKVLQYLWTGCTDIGLRDRAMENAPELIRKVIICQGIHKANGEQDQGVIEDLQAVCWIQIERVLYKFRALPRCRHCYHELPHPDYQYHGAPSLQEVVALYPTCPNCGRELATAPLVEPTRTRYGGSSSIVYMGASKLFNMWNQVARNSALAYMKKQRQDRTYSHKLEQHKLDRPTTTTPNIDSLVDELRERFQHDEAALKIIAALGTLTADPDWTKRGLISSLTDRTGLRREKVVRFLAVVRLLGGVLDNSHCEEHPAQKPFKFAPDFAERCRLRRDAV